MRHPYGIKKDYVVVGGKVKSRKTGNVVMATPLQLCSVYGIDPKKAVLVDEMTPVRYWQLRIAWWFLPIMQPRDAGDYAEHKKQIDEEYGYR